MGQVTLRQALAHSLNVAAVKVAQMAGYANVVAIARRAGMNEDIQPTRRSPSARIRLSRSKSREPTPSSLMEASWVQPAFIAEVRDAHGEVLYRQEPRPGACSNRASPT